MKKLLSLVLVLVMCAAVMSVSAFAADKPTYSPANDGTYSIPYTEGTSGSYYALLVVEGVYDEGDTPVISEDTVLYIDQGTANADGDVIFDGWIPKNDEPATVYLGGVADGPVLLGYLGSNTFIVSGTVTTDSGTTYEATVTLTGSEGAEFSATSVSGAYAVEVPEGTYTFKVNVKNHLSYTDSDFAVAADVAGKDVELLGGDIDANGSIEYLDLMELVNTYGDENADVDIDGNGVVEYFELMMGVNNYGSVSVSE